MLALTSDNSVRWSSYLSQAQSGSTGEGGVGFPCSPSGICRQAGGPRTLCTCVSSATCEGPLRPTL